MKKIIYLAVALLCAQFAVFAADPGLLSLVMPDAKVIAGVQVSQAKLSPFGSYVLSHMQPDDAAFQNFIKQTNFDPRRDLTEIVMTSSADSDITSHWLVLARGVFDPTSIARAAQANGGLVTQFQGVSILSGVNQTKPGSDSVIAFLDSTTASIGDSDAVKAVIQRYQTKSQAPATLVNAVKDVSSKFDFWFTTLAPISEFASLMPDQNMSQALKGNLFQAILQATGGLKFGNNVLFSMNATARSDKDASALVDVVRFIGGLIQSNRDKSPVAGEFSSLVDSMTLNATGSLFSMSLTIPEAQLERILDSAKSAKVHKQTAQK